MTDPTPAEAAAQLLDARYPGIRQTQPGRITERPPLSDVQVSPEHGHGYAEFMWAGSPAGAAHYKVHVNVGEPEPLDPESDALYCRVRSWATVHSPDNLSFGDSGHVAWFRTNIQSQLAFPWVEVVAVEDSTDPRYASAILTAVGRALEAAGLATVAAVATKASGDAAVASEEERVRAGLTRLEWRKELRRRQREAREGGAQ
ncbi:hypothetical protein [Streptomyces sp. CA2R106]|uniref:hypothetical protein n=1 Tax=Streptomyces sp. CA2R106 TaxID=3120153 RepID=UPI0030095CE5